MSHIPAPTGPHRGPTPSYLDLVRIREFATYWISQFISCIGDRLDQMAVIALVLRSISVHPDDRAATTILVFLFATLPYVVVTPLAAGLVDRLDRRRLMIGTDLYRAAVVLVAAFYYTTNQPIWHYYVVVFLSGCGTAVFGPCKLSFIPQLVPANNLVKANSVSSMTGTLGTLIGTFVGGQFIQLVAGEMIPPEQLPALEAGALATYESHAILAARGLLLADVVTFLISAWLLWRIRMPRGNPPYYMCQRIRECGGVDSLDPDSREVYRALTTRKQQPYFVDLIESVRYSISHKIGRRQLLLTAHLWLIVGVANAGLQAWAFGVLKLDEEAFSRVFGVLGLSMFFGGMAIGLGQRWFKPRLISTLLMLVLACLAPLPILSSSTGTLMLSIMPLGFVAGAVIIAIDSVYQLTIPNRLR
jgi:MFS family permease